MKEVGISIVIPIYRPQPVIFEVLDSVIELAQKIDVEIILVYNGEENDIGLNDLESYLNGRIAHYKGMLLNEANVSMARNSGLSVACGRFVKFLDADDILIADKVIRQHDLLAETHIDVVTGEYTARYGDGSCVLRPRRVRTPFQGLMSGEVGITSSALFRRTAIMDIRWRVELTINEEKEFYWSCAQKKLEFYHLSDAVFIKTMQPNSLSKLANGTGRTTLTVAKFRLELWKRMRNSISPGEQADCHKSFLAIFNELVRMPPMKGASLATRVLISGGLPYRELSAKQKFALITLSPFFFPIVFSIVTGLTDKK